MASSNKTSPKPIAMNNSESYTSSNKNTYDDEDFKSSIPVYTTTNDVNKEEDHHEKFSSNMERECQDANNYRYQNWNDDDEYGEEIDSKPNLDFSRTNDCEKYFPAPYSSSVYTSSTQNMQYPADMVDIAFRPPSSSSLHYNYNYPHSTPTPQRQMQSLGYAHSSQQSHLYPAHPNIHPNMWHPNAPYNSDSLYPPYGQQRFPHYSAGYPHSEMVDMLHLSNSGREARNRAEKNRRDKLNGSIQELSTMVPHVAESPRRVDKTAVLRFAAHGLRLRYVFGETLYQTRPQITDSLMKLLDSFFITLTCHGQITLISSSIEQHLGHCQADLYGQNILYIVHPEDHTMLKQQLVPTELENLFEIQLENGLDELSHRTIAEEEYIDRKLREDKRSFTIRLARAGPRSEPTSYEVVKFDGCFKRSYAAPRGVKTCSFPSGSQSLRRTRGRDDAIPLHNISGNDIVLIAIARIVRPPKVTNKIIEANSMEYKTRHLIDGRIIDCDQRIGIVAGYMTDEVRNLSPFTFMHQDDVRWVIVALRQMYDCNSSYGESTYRLLTRNGHFIYLQSKGFLEIDKETNKVHSFVCVNTLLDEEEGKRRVQDMKNKFSVIINTQIQTSSIDVPASENPQQLEKAVLCLIQNLHKTPSEDEESDASVSQFNRSMQYTAEVSRPISSCSTRSTKTPPLALVPPEASSVRTSITKSISIVNVTAAKNLRGNMQQTFINPKSPSITEVENTDSKFEPKDPLPTYSCHCQCQNSGIDCDECLQFKQRISKLKRTTSCSEIENLVLPKRRLKSTEIQQVITSSLDQIGRSLDQQLNAAIELRDQRSKYEIPHSSQRIEEIMEEHQKQKEIYVNIKNEYEVQIHNKGIDANTTKTTDSPVADKVRPR